jgi:hypothetical protein
LQFTTQEEVLDGAARHVRWAGCREEGASTLGGERR